VKGQEKAMSHIRRRSRAAHFGVAIVLAVAATMAVPLFAVASPAAAAGPTPITTCNYLINTPGRYVVTTDLTCVNQFDFGIVIEASNVNLTLNGHTLNGQSVAGWHLCRRVLCFGVPDHRREDHRTRHHHGVHLWRRARRGLSGWRA